MRRLSGSSRGRAPWRRPRRRFGSRGRFAGGSGEDRGLSLQFLLAVLLLQLLLVKSGLPFAQSALDFLVVASLCTHKSHPLWLREHRIQWLLQKGRTGFVTLAWHGPKHQ